MPAHLPPSREQHAPPRLAQLDGVDAALDKWSGREERMFTALNKKYDAEIKAYWDSQEPDKEEL